MTDSRQFVIIGAGQAGAWIARTLRSEGFQGAVRLIGEEPHWPYERPPLSKEALVGEARDDAGALLSAEQAEALGIETWLDVGVKAIDRPSQQVLCVDGRSLPYDILFLATGSSPRRSPLTDALDPDRVHYLRTRHDAARLKAALAPGQRLAVMGAGWIGLEVAASARSLGVDVVLIDAASRVCARSVPQPVSAYLQRLHAGRQVDIRLEECVLDLVSRDHGIEVALASSGVLRVDHLLVGIGAAPNVHLAEACGLAVDNGVLVDAAGRTSDPRIFAAGDVTNHMNRFAGRRVRLESWENATAQAVCAAKSALGQTANYDEVPWIWSDQYDANVQIVGFVDQVANILKSGAPEAGKGCWLMLGNEGNVVGAVAVNAPRELRTVRKAMRAGTAFDISPWSPVD